MRRCMSISECSSRNLTQFGRNEEAKSSTCQSRRIGKKKSRRLVERVLHELMDLDI